MPVDEMLFEEGGFFRPLNMCVGLFILIVALLGAVVCLVNFRRSSWLMLSALGFLGMVLLVVIGEVGQLFIFKMDLSFKVIGGFFFLLRLGELVSLTLVVAGFGLALMGMKGQPQGSQPTLEPPRAPFPPPAAGEPFRPRNEGSPDIQP
jgi:hypothetical protein